MLRFFQVPHDTRRFSTFSLHITFQTYQQYDILFSFTIHSVQERTAPARRPTGLNYYYCDPHRELPNCGDSNNVTIVLVWLDKQIHEPKMENTIAHSETCVSCSDRQNSLVENMSIHSCHSIKFTLKAYDDDDNDDEYYDDDQGDDSF